MSNSEAYTSKLNEIKAIKEDQIITKRNIPMYIYIQEAENLHIWSQPDKEILVGRGFDWKIAEDISVLVGALREAESRWLLHRFTKPETVQKWSKLEIKAFELLKLLLHEFRFAYRFNNSVLNRVNALAGSQNTMAIIQNLNDLSVLGKENTTELNAIKLDLKILDEAADLTNEMSIMLAAATVAGNTHAVKKIRDQAFTLLKIKVDELCAYGQHCLWKDESRKKGYSSSYLRRVRNHQKRKEKEQEQKANDSEGSDLGQKADNQDSQAIETLKPEPDSVE